MRSAMHIDAQLRFAKTRPPYGSPCERVNGRRALRTATCAAGPRRAVRLTYGPRARTLDDLMYRVVAHAHVHHHGGIAMTGDGGTRT